MTGAYFVDGAFLALGVATFLEKRILWKGRVLHVPMLVLFSAFGLFQEEEVPPPMLCRQIFSPIKSILVSLCFRGTVSLGEILIFHA